MTSRRQANCKVFVSVVAALALAASWSAAAQRLYRWTDERGEVHYSDQIPPEAIDRARREINRSGLTVRSVDRAMTPAERLALGAAQADAAAQARAAEEASRADAMLLNAYASESDLERSYADRFELLEQARQTAALASSGQREALETLLSRAATTERQGKVDAETDQRIRDAYASFVKELAKADRHMAERAAVEREKNDRIIRYRELQQESRAERAADNLGT